MPKVKPLIWTPDDDCKRLKKNIKICMIQSNVDPEKLAGLLQISRSSVYSKLRDPQKMTFFELCKFAHIFKVNVADLMKEGEA